MIASPSIRVALLTCCSARNIFHVGDLYPASSFSSICSASFRIMVISSCSQPFHLSFFFKKFQAPLVIVHPRPGSMHVDRPSVVMILVPFTYSSHTKDDSCILMNPPFGISWSRNHVLPISRFNSCSGRSLGSLAAVDIDGASHKSRRVNADPSWMIGFLMMIGCLVQFCFFSFTDSHSLLHVSCRNVSICSSSSSEPFLLSSDIKSAMACAR